MIDKTENGTGGLDQMTTEKTLPLSPKPTAAAVIGMQQVSSKPCNHKVEPGYVKTHIKRIKARNKKGTYAFLRCPNCNVIAVAYTP